jgi:hypothetical protein
VLEALFIILLASLVATMVVFLARVPWIVISSSLMCVKSLALSLPG